MHALFTVEVGAIHVYLVHRCRNGGDDVGACPRNVKFTGAKI